MASAVAVLVWVFFRTASTANVFVFVCLIIASAVNVLVKVSCTSASTVNVLDIVVKLGIIAHNSNGAWILRTVTS